MNPLALIQPCTPPACHTNLQTVRLRTCTLDSGHSRDMVVKPLQLLLLLAHAVLLAAGTVTDATLAPRAPSPLPPASLVSPDARGAPWAQFAFRGRPFAEDLATSNATAALQQSLASSTVRVAFIADMDLRSAGLGRAVLGLVHDFGAELTVAAGDLDYMSLDQHLEPDRRRNYPDTFLRAVDDILGPSHVLLPALGNHEVDSGVMWQRMPGSRWAEDRSYAQALHERMLRLDADAHCAGFLGADVVCDYSGLLVFQSGLATVDEPWDLTRRRTQHEEALADALSTYSSRSRWRICSWHVVARALNTGDLPRSTADDPGYEAYHRCQQAGGIVVNGHEHTYSRSKALHRIPNDGQIEAHGPPYWYAERAADPLSTPPVPSRPELVVLSDSAPGSGLVIVNGIGGQDMRVLGKGKTGREGWWATTRTSDQGRWRRNDPSQSGALLCEFGRIPDSALWTSSAQLIALYDLPLEVSSLIGRDSATLASQSGECKLQLVTGEVVDQFHILNINRVETTTVTEGKIADDIDAAIIALHGEPLLPAPQLVQTDPLPPPGESAAIPADAHGTLPRSLLLPILFCIFLSVVVFCSCALRRRALRRKEQDLEQHML